MQELQLGEGTSAQCPLPEQFSTTRPAINDKPTEVGVGLYLVDIPTFDDVEQFFAVDLYLILQWTDSRLADPLRGDGYASCVLPVDEVWHPIVQFDKVRSLQKHYQDVTVIDDEGTVTLAQRFYLEISVPLNLRDFPLDEHILTVDISPVFTGTQELVFNVLESLTGREKELSLSGWKLDQPRAGVTEKYGARRHMDFSHFSFTLTARREAGFYIWKLVIPLMFIVFMSWVVFWIDPSAPSGISLSATSMLTLIAYQFAITSYLPRISYLTRADKFTLCSFVLVFLSLIEAAASHYLTRKGKTELAAKFDQLSRWVFPSLFAGIFFLAFL